MSLPARTIVYFHYRRDGNALIPTTGGLRDAKRAEYDHPLNHIWFDELPEGVLRLNLAVQGFEIRPMNVAIEHVNDHCQEWESHAREAIAREYPDCELIEPARGDEEASDEDMPPSAELN